MGQITDDQLNALCIKLQGLEITHLIGAPADQQWAVRGLRESKDPARPYNGDAMAYPAALPSEAVAKAIADNP